MNKKEKLYQIREPAKLEKKLPLDLMGKKVNILTKKKEIKITYS